MNKHYTSIEQSEHLLELGLSPETADCMWEQHNGLEPYVTVKPHTTLGKSIGAHALPCWSVGALIDVLPKGITIKNKWKEINHLGDKIHYACHILLLANTVVYECTVEEAPKHHILAMYENDSLEGENTLMNNVYRMVCWLLENNYIRQDRLQK